MFQKVYSLFKHSSPSFQILSDLHLEINHQYASYDIPVCAEYLILAGDIGRLTDYEAYRDFLQKQTDRFKLVFLVLGNHEFYNGTFATGLDKARQLEQEPALNGRLIVLHQRRFDIPGCGLTIQGCTLWSNVPSELTDLVRSKVKDFQKIEDWSVEEHNTRHEADLAWLVNEIDSINLENEEVKKQSEKRSTLVVTHHAPLLQGTSSPQHAQNPWSVAFGTDVLPQIPNGVKVWVFGHTHYSTDFREKGVRVVSNQRGYVLPWSTKVSGRFDERKVIRIS
ncbi:calcineurin-like phosphoesterase [Aspergillus ibericus CBS 121593]|uniref:Calcineurin-like phosphoesterase n=1 Tax=Aspergillus ibericus CBS 121593 TaxID=1448316 RepID=A0A395H3J4_9EURO|nr:calcineurin-like phosphoesterase [Aspergillus ibericus CBS 121593]RAL01775.1 calcineurin-like phosphoesterase [Aspergillus ibericus CBS 121593]